MLHTVRIANLLLLSAMALGLSPTSAHVGPESAPPRTASVTGGSWQAWNPPSPDAASTASSDRIFRIAYLDDALLQAPERSGVRSVPPTQRPQSSEASDVEQAEARVSAFRLPEPGAGSVLLATAALTGFFFIRRLAH